MFAFRITILIFLGFMPFAAQAQPAFAPVGADQRKTGTVNTRLVRMLTGRNEQVRMRTLLRMRQDPEQLSEGYWSLLSALEKETQADDDSYIPPSLVEMIDLIASVDRPESETVLIKLLDSENADVSMMTADAIGRKRFFGAIDDLERQVSRSAYAERYAFRFNLVRALSNMRHPDAVESLGRLQLKLDGQLRFEIDAILSDVTLDDFRGDQERFDSWQQRNDEVPVFQQVKFRDQPKDPKYNRIRFAKPNYYGIDIRAGRIMFVLDHSGSMKAPTSSGSRLLRAKHELIRAIRELPENTEFAIVTFDSNVRHWRNELSLATEDHKRAAILFVQRLALGNDTNTHGALRRALDFDETLEAVFVLTDGKPTVGQITSPTAIANDILHRNRWRHLNINTIGISVKGPTESFLRSLAANSGGEFRAVD